MLQDPGQVFRWPVRVYYEDTDFGGVVYYANYLRFFERARTEWLRSLGVDHQALRGEEPMAVALVQAACIDRKSFKPAPIPASLAARLAA